MSEKLTKEDKVALDEAKKNAMASLIGAEAFVMVLIVDGDVQLVRGVRDGYQKLAMVGAMALAIATMNNETLHAGGVEYNPNLH